MTQYFWNLHDNHVIIFAVHILQKNIVLISVFQFCVTIITPWGILFYYEKESQMLKMNVNLRIRKETGAIRGSEIQDGDGGG